MKVLLFISILVQGIVAAIVQRQQNSCTNDNCALAVNPRNATLAAIARADCSSYLHTTITVGLSTTTLTSTSTNLIFTGDECISTPAVIIKRGYGPPISSDTSSNSNSNTPSSVPGFVNASATSALPLASSRSSSSAATSLFTLPPYATPCGIPYYYSSACSCISIFQSNVYKTEPLVTSIVDGGTINIQTISSCAPTDTTSFSESSSSSVPTTLTKSTLSTWHRSNLTLPAPAPTTTELSIFTVFIPSGTGVSSDISFSSSLGTAVSPTGNGSVGTGSTVTGPIGTDSLSTLPASSPPFPMVNDTSTLGPTGGATGTMPGSTGSVPTSIYSSVPSFSPPFPLSNSTSAPEPEAGPTGIEFTGTDTSTTGQPTSPPFPINNSTLFSGPSGSTGTVTGTGTSASGEQSSPPFPLSNSTSAPEPEAGPTGTGLTGTGTGASSTGQPTSPPFPINNSTLFSGPSGSTGTGASTTGEPSSPPFPLSNSTSPLEPSAGPTGTGFAGTGTSTIEQPSSPPFPANNSTIFAGPTGTSGTGISTEPTSSPPFLINNSTLFSGSTGPTGTGTSAEGQSSSPPFPINNSTLFSGPTGPTGTGTSIAEQSSSPPFPINNSTISSGPAIGTGSISVGTGILTTIASPSPPLTINNSSSCLDSSATGPVGTGMTGTAVTGFASSLLPSSSVLFPNNTEPTASPTTPSSFGATGVVMSTGPPIGTGLTGTAVTGLTSSLLPSPSVLFPNSTDSASPTIPSSFGATGVEMSTGASSISTPFPNSTLDSPVIASGSSSASLTESGIPSSASVSVPLSTDIGGLPSTSPSVSLATGSGGPLPMSSSSAIFTNSTSESPLASDSTSLPTVSSSSSAVIATSTSSCIPSVYNSTIPNADIGYQANYAADYTGCFLDPNDTKRQLSLVENGTATPIVNVNGYAKRAPLNSPFSDSYFTFEKPANAPCGVYDLAYHFEDEVSYIAVFADGVVAFVPESSSGQDITDLANQYITTIWSIDCGGALAAGVVSILELKFNFVETAHRGVLMVASFEFDNPLLRPFKREARKPLGEEAGKVTLSLSPQPMPRGGGTLGKRGPKPKSNKVLHW